MPEVGDRVRVESRKLGEAVREGVVTDVIGQVLRVRWSTGEESTFTPGPGSLTVVGKVRGGASRSRSSKETSVDSSKKTAKKSAARKAVPKKPR
jgi:hypothetical protein